MNLQRVFLRGTLFCGLFLCLFHVPTVNGQARPRVVEAVDVARRVTLRGNVHPLARAEFDRGAVAGTQPMKRILLLLKRSDEQEAALEDLLEKQQDKSTPNFHQWLTPEQFGAQFGVADADIQAVTDWLTRQGFSVGKIYSSKTVIEFSGTVAQVQQAFGTAIHNFEVEGKTYSANATDPQIPAALAPMVTGVVSLHNFPHQSHARYLGEFQKTPGKPGLQPLFTFPLPNGNGNFYGMGPGDFATIYNSKTLISGGNDGTGQVIGIVGETQINPEDIIHFRTMFGLPLNFTASNIILNGEDPGITSINEESEADLDVQWSGAVAPGATIKYVVSASTPASQGVDLSALYIVEHNLADVMSESYGACEKNLGTTENQFYYRLWEQAAAQGITVMVSSGDGGTAGCDNFDTQQTATQGLAVSGFASTPFNVSVGGTDFDQATNPALYWNATNDATGTSAKGYIPEIPWNESCAQIGLTGCGASAPNGSLNIVAGSGGQSSLYGKPTWQMGVTGMPNDNHRDQPDVSLFASPGFDGTGYVICQQDRNLNGVATCDLNTTNGSLDFHVVGGTSASAPAFAGVMALVNQYQAAHGGSSRQGNANHTLYALAKKSGASCPSSTTEAVGCIFNDVVAGNSFIASRFGSSVGTNSVPCQGGSANCSVSTGSSNGVLVDPVHTTTEAWKATTGYDMATGLGTLNVNNLATKWGTASTVSTTTSLTLAPTSGITHGTGENVRVSISVSPKTGTATGDVSLIAKFSDGTTQGLDQFTLASGGTFSGQTSSLPGGTNYQVFAHYAGDGTNAPSDSTFVNVTVAPEGSKTFIVVPTFDTNGNTVSGNATTFPYGTTFIVRGYATDKNGVANPGGPPSPTCFQENALSCPTGTITLTDNGHPLGQGIFRLNDAGYTRDLSETASTFTGGLHNLQASYSGDNSFAGSTGSTLVTVTPAPTTTQDYLTEFYAVVGQPLSIGFIANGSVPGGVTPTGTFTFDDSGSPIGNTTGTSSGGEAILGGILVTFMTVGKHNVTATYSGDANYASSSSSPTAFYAQYTDSIAVSANPSVVNYGSPVTLTAKVTTAHLSPTLAGQIVFQVANSTPTTSLTTDGSGNQILTSSVTFTPQSSATLDVGYGNDQNYVSLDTNVSYTVNLPDFSMASNPGSLTITAGQSGSATINVAPLTGISSTVALTCSTPSVVGTMCSLNPTSVNLANNASGTTTITLSTLGPSASATTAAVRRKNVLSPWHSPPDFWWLRMTCASFALVAIHALLLGKRKRKYATLFGLVSSCVLLMAFGCGGGGGGVSGGGGGGGVGGGGQGGGGGGGGPVPTSVTLTTSDTKVPAGNSPSITLTATVQSTNAVSGTITFWEKGNGGALAPTVSLVGGTASAQVALPLVGTHQIYAQYSGDAKNQASQSSTINVVASGSAFIQIQGVTGPISHYTNVNLTIQ